MADDEKNTTGAIDPGIWDEQVAVTGRPNDEAPANSTFGERAKAGKADVEKADTPAKKAAPRKKA